jgi:hypothetical protein
MQGNWFSFPSRAPNKITASSSSPIPTLRKLGEVDHARV